MSAEAFISFTCAQCLQDIDSALQKIDDVASNRDGIAAEESLILRGYVVIIQMFIVDLPYSSPQAGQLDAYKEALERLNATIAFKSSSDSRETARRVASTIPHPC